jgi:hypothetical protein
MNKHHDGHPVQDQKVSYWKRAHTDWRFRVAVAIMFVAILVYVLSGDLSWRPHLQTGTVHQ